MAASGAAWLPLLPPDADPRGYELTMLTASPDWARVAATAGVPMNLRLVPDAGWARTAARRRWKNALRTVFDR